MTKTDTRDANATLDQIRALAEAGCDLVRVAVPDLTAATALREIVAHSPIPVIADIHFDADLAVRALEAGAHAVRVNPGNIGGEAGLRAVAAAAAHHGAPIRVGVNSGSLEPDVAARLGRHSPEALVESALRYCARLERLGCRDLKVSLKSSSVRETVAAYRLFAARSDYPLHVGLTEAGPPASGLVKSAVALGSLLLDGIGDTLRVSLTADPVREVEAGLRILQATGLRAAHPEIVSCPTCGRTGIDVAGLVERLEQEVADLRRQGLTVTLRKVAVMGCIVNGPGEARDADVGVAGGAGKGALFRNGSIVRSLPESELASALLEEVRRSARPARPEATSPGSPPPPERLPPA